VRATAVASIARIGTEAAIAPLDRAAHDADPLVRLEAVRGLGAVPLPKTLERLRALAAAGDVDLRVAAIEQLGTRKDRGAVTLLRKISQDPVESLRNAARQALEAIGA
jgi:HEAT repeat protein